ncbi:ubiquitin-protein ligase-like protein E3 [Xylogone sp. PMI_703]|nr:ubiquitin-protein ligase-like protein E3 [Xylogone sp. PMI_703]
MAPWPTRFHPSASNNESNSAAKSTSLDRNRRPSRITEDDILENAFGIPTLPPSQSSRRRTGSSGPSRPTGHARSMSHPFPSLFSGRKKNNSSTANISNISLSESSDENLSSADAPHKAPNTGDLRTGRCMTCDSTVRWPKELKVFRCTICLTINDLQPVFLQARRGDGHRVPCPSQKGRVSTAYLCIVVAPISTEKTRQIIDQCITTYLVAQLRHGPNAPSRSPSPPNIRRADNHHSAESRKASENGRSLTGNAKAGTAIPAMALYNSPHDGEYRSSRGKDIERQEHIPSGVYSTSYPGTSSIPGKDLKEKNPVSHQTEISESSYLWAEEDMGHDFPGNRTEEEQEKRHDLSKRIFKALEDYIIPSLSSFECINTSFTKIRPAMAPRAASEGSTPMPITMTNERRSPNTFDMSELDAKMLLLGDVAENGSWWTGNNLNTRSSESSRPDYRQHQRNVSHYSGLVTPKSPCIDWTGLNEWYHMVLYPARSWRDKLSTLLSPSSSLSGVPRPSGRELNELEDAIMEAQSHVRKVFMKATEGLLKRPGRLLVQPEHLRFLLILLENPLLHPPQTGSASRDFGRSRSSSQGPSIAVNMPNIAGGSKPQHAPRSSNPGNSGQHSGIIKRILGLISNAPNECHHRLIAWFARYSDNQFQKTTDLIGSFFTYRLTRQHGKKREVSHDITDGLIPDMSGTTSGVSAALHTALFVSGSSSKKAPKPVTVTYTEDWQIKASARVMALLFSANNSGIRKRETRSITTLEMGHSAGLVARERARRHGQIIPTSDFYNSLLDYSDLISDFEGWESKRAKFSFCQYPFFLSIWAKIQIMEHDARRQMEVKAREAFFDSIMSHKTVNQYIVLKVRRECLVEDSLRGVSEVVGSGGEEIKKGLRIEFQGEEGIDAGGLRKEWFLLLVRDVFNPDHGMFVYDDDSHFCYFNPYSFETTDQYFLVGVVLGLAIYNSTILDVALPSFAFRKLLASGPAVAPGSMSHPKPPMTYSLEDLAEFRPALAAGLQQLLDFEGDVEGTFCRDFVAEIDRYGQIIEVPLCPGGEKKPVTNANRREFVDLYVRYLLDTAVTRQFEPFKRGFFSVCGGNALSLFQPEEIELLIRGSDEPLDIASLRAVAIYENWGVKDAATTETVIQWFWQSFETANARDQRKLLTFITGSDRIPAMGATNLKIKISCLGDDSPRFPIARTCFNTLSLWRYSSKKKLETMLWRAVYESEGFGLK